MIIYLSSLTIEKEALYCFLHLIIYMYRELKKKKKELISFAISLLNKNNIPSSFVMPQEGGEKNEKKNLPFSLFIFFPSSFPLPYLGKDTACCFLCKCYVSS